MSVKNLKTTTTFKTFLLLGIYVCLVMSIGCAAPKLMPLSDEDKERYKIYSDSELKHIKHKRLWPVESYHCKRLNNFKSANYKIGLKELAREAHLLGGNALTNLECTVEGTSVTKNCWESIKCTATAINIGNEGSGDTRTANDDRQPKQVPQFQQPPKAVESIYSGTGFLFSSKDYVITNWHVVRGMTSIKVMFLNGEKINAKVVLKDTENDIAFLKLEQSPQLPASEIRIGDSSGMRMGDEVFTIGYPAHQILGMNPKYTKGEVNALSGISDDPRVFQVSVQIQPGNSGGPLFNSKGEVIGVTQASLDPKVAMGTFGALPQNVNYAIKSSYISNLLPMLPETMIASRSIVVVPTDPKNNLANFIDKVKKNIVLIEAKE